ncbi:MAG: ATP-binding cassette domain-containing protein [Deltaproteobacteria bacterium]|nr:ATP-binding cassette domain-containing protein [Deltaproteobacteria bacterium]
MRRLDAALNSRRLDGACPDPEAARWRISTSCGSMPLRTGHRRRGKHMRVDISEVSKSFGPVKGLDHVSAAFGPGEVVAVVGLNGAGKTTLLRTLAAIVGPDSGEIRFDGEPFRRDRLDLRKRLAFLPDFPPLTSATVARHIATVLTRLPTFAPASPVISRG